MFSARARMTETRKIARAKLVLLGRENCGKTGKGKGSRGGTYGLLIINCPSINNISLPFFVTSDSASFTVSLALVLFKIQLCV